MQLPDVALLGPSAPRPGWTTSASFICQFKVDAAVIGVSSIEPDGTLLDYDYREVRVAQAIIAHARETWLVADHSKFSRGAMVRLGHLSQVSRFFTDAPVSGPVQKVLEESRVQLLVAEPEPSGAQG